MGRLFVFSLRLPIYGSFVYLAFPRWVLGVNARPRGASPLAPRKPTARYGTVKWRNYE